MVERSSTAFSPSVSRTSSRGWTTSVFFMPGRSPRSLTSSNGGLKMGEDGSSPEVPIGATAARSHDGAGSAPISGRTGPRQRRSVAGRGAPRRARSGQVERPDFAPAPATGAEISHPVQVPEPPDTRHIGMGALAGALGYAVVLFIDASPLVRLTMWLGWMLFVAVIGYAAMPAWRETPVRKAWASRLLLIEATVVTAVATVAWFLTR